VDDATVLLGLKMKEKYLSDVINNSLLLHAEKKEENIKKSHA
jgi:hypothetical protein